MKFQVNSTIGHVIACNYTYGSPQIIFVNSNGILHVANIDNSRIQRLIFGNRNGTTVMSMHEDENFFVTIKSENILKRIEKKSMINSKKNVI